MLLFSSSKLISLNLFNEFNSSLVNKLISPIANDLSYADPEFLDIKFI